MQYAHIASNFSLVYPEYLLDINCRHLSSDPFSMDLDDASRRQVWTFQGEKRQKTRKWIAERLMGSSPLRLSILGRKESPRRLPRAFFMRLYHKNATQIFLIIKSSSVCKTYRFSGNAQTISRISTSPALLDLIKHSPLKPSMCMPSINIRS